jgi:hypothetical protein
MKQLFRNIAFWLELNIGLFVTSGNKIDRFEKMIKSKYPEKFKKK